MNWPEIERLYLEASALPAKERAAFLEQACAADAELRRKVEGLLQADADQSDFLQEPPAYLTAQLVEDLDKQVLYIGNYRIIGLLGEGGMGMVYQAEQQMPRRTVALKVIKPGMVGERLLRRFQQEAEALGRLQHPGIAQIHDAGAAEQGFGPQPFFAMELVDGPPILRYAEENKLDARAKLELMAKVCDAVHHAHQRGILHRDLKPANILVDHTGQPKILDFGVARVMDSDIQATRQTDLGQLVGTLSHMSPEQASGNTQELDTRSDVYSLGVTLYELLTGQLPYQIKDLPIHEAVRIIQEQDPTALSSIEARYRGDVEIIVEKALEKSKDRRYGSAAELASDIQRYLNHEPITARPPSAIYQLTKFARRNRALVAVLAALVVGSIASSYEAVRALAAERQANSAATSARAVSDFLRNDLLAQASTDNQGVSGVRADPNLTVRAALDLAASHIAGRFAKQPEIEADIRGTIASTYSDLGLYTEEREQLGRALELRQRIFGRDDPRTLQTQTQLAGCLLILGMLKEAESLIQPTIASQRRILGPEHPDLLASQTVLAHIYHRHGRVSDALALTEQVLAIRRRVLGVQNPATIGSQRDLSTYYMNQGDLAKADLLIAQVVEMDRRTVGPENSATLEALGQMALIRMSQGRLQEAVDLFRQVIATSARLKGPKLRLTIYAMNNLAICLIEQRRFAEAESISRESLGKARQSLGWENRDTGIVMVVLSKALFLEKKYVESEQVCRQILGMERRALGQDHFLVDVGCAIDLAQTYLEQRKFAASESWARKAMDFHSKFRPDHIDRFMSEGLVGASLMGRKRFSEAEPHLIAAYRGLEARQLNPLGPTYAAKLRSWIVKLYRAWGKPDQAKAWVARKSI